MFLGLGNTNVTPLDSDGTTLNDVRSLLCLYQCCCMLYLYICIVSSSVSRCGGLPMLRPWTAMVLRWMMSGHYYVYHCYFVYTYALYRAVCRGVGDYRCYAPGQRWYYADKCATYKCVRSGSMLMTLPDTVGRLNLFYYIAYCFIYDETFLCPNPFHITFSF